MKEKKKTQVQETVPSFIFRVQTAHRYITDACEPGEYCIPLKKNGRPLSLEQDKACTIHKRDL